MNEEFQKNDIASEPSDSFSDASSAKNKDNKESLDSKIFNVLLVVLVVLLAVAVLLRFFVGCRIKIEGSSMEPNFYDDEQVWVNKLATPRRGDVVVLFKNDLTVSEKIFAEFCFGKMAQQDGKYQKLIKRVVALGGDKIWLEQSNGGCVAVIKTSDGEILREDYYVDGDKIPVFYGASKKLVSVPWMENNANMLGNLYECYSEETAYLVPEGYFYFMGDNRNNSTDARKNGAVPLSCVYGVVEY